MTVATVPDVARALVEWLPRQRWFGRRAVAGVELRVLAEFTGENPDRCGVLAVAEVEFADLLPPRRYLVPLGFAATPPADVHPMTWVNGRAVYDATSDPAMTAELLWLICRNQTRGPVRFTSEPTGGLAFAHRNGLRPRKLDGEQSNTSIVFGDRFILKLFRQLPDGLNPDLSVHRALGRAGSQHVAPLLGAIEADIDGTKVTCGMLNSFASDAVDGWRLAEAEVRDVVSGEPAGGRTWAGSLGAAVAAVHQDLAGQFGTGVAPANALRDLLLRRLVEAVAEVPALRTYHDFLADAFTAVGQVGPIEVQRVHGDLHLAQALRTPVRWLLIDFEGEPALSIADRVAYRSPLRDVAGMLRSFDYAAQMALRGPDVPPEGAVLAGEWVTARRAEFCAGYADNWGGDPRDEEILLRAHELEKVVYETVYETRHRPAWARIPLRALRMMADED